MLDAFVTVDTDEPLVITWDAELDERDLQVFQLIAEQLPYLGRAESLISARVTEDPVFLEDHRMLGPGLENDLRQRQLRLLSPAVPLDLDSLLTIPWKERAQGYAYPRSCVRLPYSGTLEWPSGPRRDRVDPPVDCVEWRLHGRGPIPVIDAVAYCDMLRFAVIKACDGNDEAERLVSGKGQNGEPSVGHHSHAHFLPLPGTDNPRELVGLALWIPSNVYEEGPGVPTSIRDAVRSVQRLFRGDQVRPVRLYLQGTRKTDAAVFGTSSAWTTLTPYAPARHLRSDARFQRSLQTEVNRELAERGLPPATVNFIEPSNRPHPLDYRRHRLPPKEYLRNARRAMHLRLDFDEPVRGPICLGALSHFGLGTFVVVRAGTTTRDERQ